MPATARDDEGSAARCILPPPPGDKRVTDVPRGYAARSLLLVAIVRELVAAFEGRDRTRFDHAIAAVEVWFARYHGPRS